MSSAACPSAEYSPAAERTLAEYAALRQRVDAFFSATSSRHPDAMHCRAGCHGCCQAGLSVSAIEAAAIRDHLQSLSPAEQRAIFAQVHTRAQALQAAVAAQVKATEDPPCVLLRDDGRCAIYPVRPLVCRSQGLPLSYAAELIPPQALRFVAKDGRAVVCCPLNFCTPGAPADAATETTNTPQAADILDAERLDLLLAVLNRRFVEQTGQDTPHAIRRTALADLVQLPDDSAPTPTADQRGVAVHTG